MTKEPGKYRKVCAMICKKCARSGVRKAASRAQGRFTRKIWELHKMSDEATVFGAEEMMSGQFVRYPRFDNISSFVIRHSSFP